MLPASRVSSLSPTLTFDGMEESVLSGGRHGGGGGNAATGDAVERRWVEATADVRVSASNRLELQRVAW